MSTSIATALFGKTQRAVLGLLFGQPDRSFYLRELVVAAASGASQVQRELNALTEAGLIVRTPRGNQVWFTQSATLATTTTGTPTHYSESTAPSAAGSVAEKAGRGSTANRPMASAASCTWRDWPSAR